METTWAPIAVAIAQTAIDYSNQPPRELQLAAGTSLAIAGFIITFAVLGIFTVLIKATSIIAEKLEKKQTIPKPPMPPHAPPSPPNPELVAAAVAVAHMISTARRTRKQAAPAQPPARAADPWVLADRINPPTALERGPSLEDYEIEKWRRGT